SASDSSKVNWSTAHLVRYSRKAGYGPREDVRFPSIATEFRHRSEMMRRAPSDEETEKERVSDANRNRDGRSGLSGNLDLQREGHGDDRARHQPGLGHAGLWHSQRGLLGSNRATPDSGSRVHRGGTIRLVRGETRQPLPDLHARRLGAVTAGHAPRRLLSVGDRSGS